MEEITKHIGDSNIDMDESTKQILDMEKNKKHIVVSFVEILGASYGNADVTEKVREIYKNG